MNMMNKCAKFHKDSSSCKKVKFNLARAIELSETAVCVQLCVETLSKRATSVAQLTNFSFEFFYESFTEDASLSLLCHGAKKSKMTKNSNQGGPALSQRDSGRLNILKLRSSCRKGAFPPPQFLRKGAQCCVFIDPCLHWAAS